MKNVKVLGSGCKRCMATADMARAEAEEARRRHRRSKRSRTSPRSRNSGSLSTPGVVIDGKVVHTGGLPKPEDMAKWLVA